MAKLTPKPRGRALVRVAATVLTASTLLIGCDDDFVGVPARDVGVDATDADAPADAGTDAADSGFVGI